MKPKTIFRRMAVVVATLMCALSANAAEAYANYTPSNTTLTFYYDNNRSSRSGTTYDLNTSDDDPGWFTDGTYENVTKVVFDASFANARPTTTHAWFYDMQNLQSITGMKEYLNTSAVTNMAWMFADCYKLESLDVSSFNTAKVEYMDYMFRDCYNLKSLDVSRFSTSKVTNMESMFDGLTVLTSLDVSRFNTANVENMSYMFADCSSLTSLDVSHFNTSKVTNMESMFRSGALKSIDLSSFDTSNVTDMNYMFYLCNELTSLDLSSFNTSKVTSMGMMFYVCFNLKTIYVGDGWSTAAVTESGYMFANCPNLVGGKGTTYKDSNPKDKTYAHIDGGPSNPGYLTDIHAPRPYACYTPENTTLTFYYDNNRSSRTGTTYDLNTGKTDTGWDTDGTNKNVTKVVFDPSFADARPTTTYDWFYNMENLQSITGVGYLNTSEVTNMGYMFCNCVLLKSIDLSHFDTSKVTSMHKLFTSCHLLKSIDLSHFNTSKVTNMNSMFANCGELQTICVGDGWSTAKVTESNWMFDDCFSLKGGQGTTYNSSYVDKTYAHIDEGASNPGYFSDTSGLVTHIEAVPVKANTVKGIYTLDGRKLNELPTQKGIYIIDGHKVVIK